MSFKREHCKNISEKFVPFLNSFYLYLQIGDLQLCKRKVALAVVAGVTAYNAQNKEELSDLALENIEALAGGETNTSWNCTGYWGSCYAYCGSCGATVRGDGELTGTHSCR